ncbi:MAG: molecular chaperone HtpG, partial [Proteobacteria bacterium]|nr:molecular chaperone HtpG [Pseudomonadota bacterium]
EHGFKAEVQQLLQLMIRSVYSDREVFLRELVSNSADALDKIRFLELTRKDLVDAAGEPGVRIKVDEEAKTITIEDDGIGMSEEEIIENLGTIAHSGSKTFLDLIEGASKEDLPKLIGKFGVGFYSAFMVAREVIVETRSAIAEHGAVRWSSKGEGTYAVEPGDKEHRGTTITLFLRHDADEFASTVRISSIIRRHSNFLPWPIMVDDEQANSGKALWVEPSSNITDEEANSFYQSLTFDHAEPAARVHLAVDSPIQYHALLFVPSERPYDLFQPEVPRGPRLYAQRVLIEEHAKELLPDWLRFLRGVVDSEDISLNVSREMVQKTPVVRKIREGLVKRILKELNRLASAEPEEVEQVEEVDEAEEAEPKSKTDYERYRSIWDAFGACLKEGYYHESNQWGEQLLPLLRFNALSLDDDQELMSLATYKEKMVEGQDDIWYLAAESRESCLASPHLEAMRKKGYDVLFLTHSVDEWLMAVLNEFDGTPIKSVARGELELEEEEEAEEGEKADLSDLTPWMEGLLEGVKTVRASNRLTDSACVLVDDEQGMSGNMERILRAANQDVLGTERVLELNARHPLIRNLERLHRQGNSHVAEPFVHLLYDDALLLEGTVREPTAMGKRLQAMLQLASEAALNKDAATT